MIFDKFEVRTRHFTADSLTEEVLLFNSKVDGIELRQLKGISKLNYGKNIIKEFVQSQDESAYIKYSKLQIGYDKSLIFEKVIANKQKTVHEEMVTKFNAQKTNYANVLEIEMKFFHEFVRNSCNEIFIDWDIISKNTYLPWDIDIIDNGKYVWNWFEIQLNPALINYFTDFKIIEKYQYLLNWDIISCDKRLKWTTTQISLFKDKIKFSLIQDERLKYRRDSRDLRFIQKYPINSGHPCGISLNPNLSKDTILESRELWNWEFLSSNPVIVKDMFFLENYLSDINLSSLSGNKGLNIQCMRFMKDLYALVDKSSRNPILKYKGIEKSWRFYWQSAFMSACVDWDVEIIEEYMPILNETSRLGGNNWNGLSRNLNNKEVIIKYSEKLNFLSLGFSNDSIIWDEDLTALLIEKKLPRTTSEFSKQTLPDLLKKIKITKSAIIKFKDFWYTTYIYEYRTRDSDGSHLHLQQFKLWTCFKNNPNVTWDDNLESHFNFRNTDLKVDQKVFFQGKDKIYIITATKEIPWIKKEIHAMKELNEDFIIPREVFPTKDYLIVDITEIKRHMYVEYNSIDVFNYEVEMI